MAEQDLVVAYYGDGAVYGASDKEHAYSTSYWPNLTNEESWVLVKVKEVPEDEAQKLMDHGTSDQWYDDGYAAANAAATYAGDIIDGSGPLMDQWNADEDDLDENPSTMGSDDFVAAVREKADLGVGYLVTDTYNNLNEKYDSAHITFYNVPKEIAGGATLFNNRLLMFVDGFGPGKNEPSPKGKVKFRVGAAELLPLDSTRPRGKTASPERMVDYVAGIITEASKLPSRLPPGARAANPAPVSASDLARKLKF